MGQRSQFYVQFINGYEQEERKENLSAMHLQWSWGWYSIQRAKQLLDFIQKEVKDTFSMFKGGGFQSAKETRDVIYGLTQINLEIGSFVKGCDLVYEEIEDKFTTEFDGKGEDYLTLRDMCRDSVIYNKKDLLFNADKHYSINPFVQDNNDGIVVIKVYNDGKIKYAFDLLQADEYRPITAKEYYKEYAEYDKLEEEDKKQVEQMIEFVDSFELLTAEELEEIFNKQYEW